MQEYSEIYKIILSHISEMDVMTTAKNMTDILSIIDAVGTCNMGGHGFSHC